MDYSSFELNCAVLGNIIEAFNAEYTLGGYKCAFIVRSFIWVIGFPFNFGGFEISEGEIHQTTLTALVAIW